MSLFVRGLNKIINAAANAISQKNTVNVII